MASTWPAPRQMNRGSEVACLRLSSGMSRGINSSRASHWSSYPILQSAVRLPSPVSYTRGKYTKQVGGCPWLTLHRGPWEGKPLPTPRNNALYVECYDHGSASLYVYSFSMRLYMPGDRAILQRKGANEIMLVDKQEHVLIAGACPQISSDNFLVRGQGSQASAHHAMTSHKEVMHDRGTVYKRDYKVHDLHSLKRFRKRLLQFIQSEILTVAPSTVYCNTDKPHSYSIPFLWRFLFMYNCDRLEIGLSLRYKADIGN